MTSSSSSAGARPSVAIGMPPELTEIVQVGTHGVLRGPLLGGEELAKRRQSLLHRRADRSAATGSARIGRSDRIVSAGVSDPARPSAVPPSADLRRPPLSAVRALRRLSAAESGLRRAARAQDRGNSRALPGGDRRPLRAVAAPLRLSLEVDAALSHGRAPDRPVHRASSKSACRAGRSTSPACRSRCPRSTRASPSCAPRCAPAGRAIGGARRCWCARPPRASPSIRAR